MNNSANYEPRLFNVHKGQALGSKCKFYNLNRQNNANIELKRQEVTSHA